MTIDEFNAKRKEMLDRAEALINEGKVNEAKALADEVKNLDAQFEAEKEATAELNLLKEQSVKPIENLVKIEENKISEKENTEMNTSALYKQAFFNTLLGKELTVEQKNAFVHTTGLPDAKSLPIPTETLNEIWSLISEEHAITKDIRKIFSKAVIEFQSILQLWQVRQQQSMKEPQMRMSRTHLQVLLFQARTSQRQLTFLMQLLQ